MDKREEGTIFQEDWMQFIISEHTKRREEKRGAADAWLKRVLYTLDFGIDLYEANRFIETAEEAQARMGPTKAHTKLASSLFDRMESMDDQEDVSKEVFLRIDSGNEELFDQIDTNGDGEINVVEWLGYIEDTHRSTSMRAEGSGLGDQWLNGLLQRLIAGADLASNYVQDVPAEAQAAASNPEMENIKISFMEKHHEDHEARHPDEDLTKDCLDRAREEYWHEALRIQLEEDALRIAAKKARRKRPEERALEAVEAYHVGVLQRLQAMRPAAIAPPP